jgi:glycosyltransferase involved in cell wall biosynthesis
VFEAFAVGTPVIGSDLGGISELVQHGQNGWLVDYNDTAAWAEALRILATDRVLLQSLQQGIGPVRTMNDVALETKELYLKLLADSAN